MALCFIGLQTATNGKYFILIQIASYNEIAYKNMERIRQFFPKAQDQQDNRKTIHIENFKYNTNVL